MSAEENVTKADAMYEDPANNPREKLHEFISSLLTNPAHTEPGAKADVLYRLARAEYELAANAKAAKNYADQKKFVYEGLKHAEEACALDGENARASAWNGIFLMEVGDLEGSRSKISKLMDVKKAWTKAADLDKSYATPHHLLGRWCYGILGIDWFSRKIANTLFGTLPETSYEEALGHFQKAEDISPNTWMSNMVYIGKCHYQLNNIPDAKAIVEAAMKLTVKNADDKEAMKEAEELMKKL
eukprot:m.136115 g.136115  ORF g.136115 m.136115 type:complete len:243 (+) comp14723_c0_seq1:189-917(+)